MLLYVRKYATPPLILAIFAVRACKTRTDAQKHWFTLGQKILVSARCFNKHALCRAKSWLKPPDPHTMLPWKKSDFALGCEPAEPSTLYGGPGVHMKTNLKIMLMFIYEKPCVENQVRFLWNSMNLLKCQLLLRNFHHNSRDIEVIGTISEKNTAKNIVWGPGVARSSISRLTPYCADLAH